MNSNSSIKSKVNDLVLEGILPLAFYNSEVINLSENKAIKNDTLIPKYQQKNIPRANSNKCISKIYDLF